MKGNTESYGAALSYDNRKDKSIVCKSADVDVINSLQDRLTSANNKIYHLVDHSELKSAEKEMVISAMGESFSINDFRGYLRSFELVKESPLFDYIEPLHIVELSKMIKAENYEGVVSFFIENRHSYRSEIERKSYFSFLISSIKNIPVLIGIVDDLSKSGIYPKAIDIFTAIDRSWSTEEIGRLAIYAKDDLNNVFFLNGYRFNLATYSASRGLDEVSLYFYRAHGVSLAVAGDMNVIDFIDLRSRPASPILIDIVESSIREKIRPFNRYNTQLLKKFVMDHGLYNVLDTSYLNEVVNKDYMMLLDGKIDSTRFGKIKNLVNESVSLHRQLVLAVDRNEACGFSKKIHASHHVKPHDNGPRAEMANNSGEANNDLSDKIINLASSMSSIQFLDAIHIKDAFDKIQEGEYEIAINDIDKYIIGKSNEDKVRILTSIASLVVPRSKDGFVLGQLIKRGAVLREGSIFMFIMNGNSDGIEFYKKFYDINEAKNSKGMSPIEFATRLNVDADIISRLK